MVVGDILILVMLFFLCLAAYITYYWQTYLPVWLVFAGVLACAFGLLLPGALCVVAALLWTLGVALTKQARLLKGSDVPLPFSNRFL